MRDLERHSGNAGTIFAETILESFLEQTKELVIVGLLWNIWTFETLSPTKSALFTSFVYHCKMLLDWRKHSCEYVMYGHVDSNLYAKLGYFIKQEWTECGHQNGTAYRPTSAPTCESVFITNGPLFRLYDDRFNFHSNKNLRIRLGKANLIKHSMIVIYESKYVLTSKLLILRFLSRRNFIRLAIGIWCWNSNTWRQH